MQVIAEASDGEEAIALYEQHLPDVLVLDLRMPKRDGVSVVQNVMERHPKARMLIMTTFDGDEDIFRSLSQGAKGYLLKDAPRTEILTAIRAVSQDRPYTSSAVAAKALQRMAKPSLTQRELSVLQEIAQGRSNKDIARRLSITEGTAKTPREVDSHQAGCDQPHGSGGGCAQARADSPLRAGSPQSPGG